MLAILNVASTQINIDGLENLTTGLKHNNGVISLDISDNALGEASIDNIIHIMKEHDLTDLNLANNHIGNDGIKKLMEFINKFQKSLKIEKLNLSGNNITHKSSHLVFDMLLKNSCLHVLNISNNHFDQDSRALSIFLEENTDM
jgi:Ran GTPase-activating protein (RanGAP) involved in mRNA processing and transport